LVKRLRDFLLSLRAERDRPEIPGTNPLDMNKEIVRTQIRNLLESVTEQIEATREYKDRIPQIEFDLILDNLRKLYDAMHLLQKVHDDAEGVPVETPSMIKSVEKMKESSRREEAARQAKEQGSMDLFGGEEPTFSIKLQEAREKGLGPKPPPPGSEHFKTLISINDKFLFINELFDGNLREYNETVETLNGFKDLKQAMEFFDLVRAKNFWDPGSTAFRRMRDLLEKRFS
jgi:hypothetical protein